MAETLIALTAALGTAAGSVGATSAAGALAGASSALTAGTGLAALVPTASTLGTIATGLSAAGTAMGAVSAANAAEFEGKQMKTAAEAEFAEGQRKADAMRREGKLALSRATALAAKSGGGVDDPSIVKMMEGIQQQADYNSMVAMYQAGSSRSKLMSSSKVRQIEGNSALYGGLAKAVGTIYAD